MQDFIDGATWYFQTGWTFLTAYNLPGVNFTPAAALFFAAFLPLSLKFIRSVIGRISPSSGFHGISRAPKSEK